MQAMQHDDDLDLAQRNRQSRERKLDRHIALVGFMGAGKSSIGARLADVLERPFYDSDDYVEKVTGNTVQELFVLGEAEFRSAEAAAVREIVAGPPAVVALGGGALQDQATRALLTRRCFVVHLYLSWADVRTGLPGLSVDRPLLQRPLAEIHELYLERQRTYRDAHVRIHVPRDDVDKAFGRVLAALRRTDHHATPSD
jgi:shikimate kinase